MLEEGCPEQRHVQTSFKRKNLLYKKVPSKQIEHLQFREFFIESWWIHHQKHAKMIKFQARLRTSLNIWIRIPGDGTTFFRLLSNFCLAEYAKRAQHRVTTREVSAFRSESTKNPKTHRKRERERGEREREGEAEGKKETVPERVYGWFTIALPLHSAAMRLGQASLLRLLPS